MEIGGRCKDLEGREHVPSSFYGFVGVFDLMMSAWVDEKAMSADLEQPPIRGICRYGQIISCTDRRHGEVRCWVESGGRNGLLSTLLLYLQCSMRALGAVGSSDEG